MSLSRGIIEYLGSTYTYNVRTTVSPRSEYFSLPAPDPTAGRAFAPGVAPDTGAPAGTIILEAAETSVKGVATGIKAERVIVLDAVNIAVLTTVMLDTDAP